jgi:hypothetical protein
MQLFVFLSSHCSVHKLHFVEDRLSSLTTRKKDSRNSEIDGVRLSVHNYNPSLLDDLLTQLDHPRGEQRGRGFDFEIVETTR